MYSRVTWTERVFQSCKQGKYHPPTSEVDGEVTKLTKMKITIMPWTLIISGRVKQNVQNFFDIYAK